ncbi:LysR family transcriptional regulator [Novacetimonas hansenii]|uniref:Transcriptional regulator n=2 Tax=Novacetimonas hansenii TaxID=436 RepID=A0ABQ0SF27_NOVHA|nr:LysR family transcriptional regulator [Novacetimonas hansenii]EFG84624.1 transcriptional regulator [Novacetimonas hansenii ATCC 23769]QOF94431.1 LysR family transcriptional regulator [Novacetimonas hansenii]GAN83003.1 transcriptional regulator LysR [Novacetimonas hansenii JCM 7643]GBQ63500.1 transcriptional regulator [Novacetimonas hansenii NRIC 0243]GEC63838.1 transcriptional regulator [Novacetimonas hansenii]
MVDRLNLDRLFVAILETGSFVAASERIGVSSGQASKMLSRLESELGVQLIQRTTRALSPTEIGQAYYERIKVILAQRDDLDASIRNISGTPSGRLRITAPMSFGNIQLMPALLAFADRYSSIRLDVSFSDHLADLVEDGFDLAVRIGRLSDSSLIARRLCDTRIVTVASPGYLAIHGVPTHPDELSRHACIIDTNFRTPNIWSFCNPTSRQPMSVPISGRIAFSNGEACMTAAERGLGIACLPSFIAGPGIYKGTLVTLLRDAEPPALGVHALYPSARHLALKVRVLSDFLADHFKGKAEWDMH